MNAHFGDYMDMFEKVTLNSVRNERNDSEQFQHQFSCVQENANVNPQRNPFNQ